jgi:hypothetical protein
VARHIRCDSGGSGWEVEMRAARARRRDRIRKAREQARLEQAAEAELERIEAEDGERIEAEDGERIEEDEGVELVELPERPRTR